MMEEILQLQPNRANFDSRGFNPYNSGPALWPAYQPPTEKPTIPIPPVSQPEQNSYARQQVNRYIVQAVPQIHQGAPIYPTVPIPAVSQPEYVSYTKWQNMNRFIVGAAPQIHQGATRMRTDPIPPVSQPEMRAYAELHKNRYIVPAPPQIHQGATVLSTIPIPPVSGPEFAYYVPHNDRYTWESHVQVSHNMPTTSAITGGGHGWYF